MVLSKEKIFFIVLLLFLCFFTFGFTTNSEANSGPLTVPQDVLDRAISNNWNNPNVVILSRGGAYYTVGSAVNTGDTLNDNWVVREYKGVFGLTCPGWNRIHGQYQPSWNWWGPANSNTIGSNSLFQLDGSFSDVEIVYTYKDILDEKGKVWMPSLTNEFLPPRILNTDEQLKTLDFELLDIQINDATTSPFYLYLFDKTENNRLVLILDLYRDYDEFIERMELDDPFSPLIFRIPQRELPRFSYQQGHTYNWQLQPALGENNVDRIILSTVNATGGGSSGDGGNNNEQINNSLNQINQGLTDLNSGISDLNNSMSETNDFLKDEDYSQDSITGNMPSNSGVSDITAESLDNIFNIIKNTFTSSNYRDIEIGIPFTDEKITIPSNLTESHVPTVILSLIRMIYWFLISRFIYKDITNYIDKLKSRRHFEW